MEDIADFDMQIQFYKSLMVKTFRYLNKELTKKLFQAY